MGNSPSVSHIIGARQTNTIGFPNYYLLVVWLVLVLVIPGLEQWKEKLQVKFVGFYVGFWVGQMTDD